MIRAIIIEDETLTADRLDALLKKHTPVQVITHLHSVKSATEWLQTNDLPDLIFLDIQLGDGTGFDVLDKIDAFPHIIFTTAFDQYVMEAFKFNSIDYLLKPIKPEELIRAVEKFEKIQPRTDLPQLLDTLGAQLLRRYKRKFLVKIGQKFQSIAVDEIAYFYSHDSCTYIKTKSGQARIIDPALDELEQLIDPANFFRVNRHVLVRADHITAIDTYFNNRLILDLTPAFDGQVIVSREKVRAFKDWLDA